MSGVHATSRPSLRDLATRALFGGADSRADRAIALVAAATAAYLAITLLPMIWYTRKVGEMAPLASHVAALALAGLAIGGRSRAARLFRDWLPLVLGAYLYIELRWLIAGVGQPHADATVLAWERALFPSDPSRTLAVQFPNLVLSEVLHACYLAYYAMIFLPPVLLYVRGRRADFAATTLALFLAFAACFLTFMIFPVDGPRFLVGAAAAPEGPVRTATLWLLDSASSRGTAFPSAHVAVSVVAAVCAVRFLRPAGYVVAVVAAGLALSTVYGGFHYAVDSVAGLVVGAGAALVAELVWRALPANRGATATAPKVPTVRE